MSIRTAIGHLVREPKTLTFILVAAFLQACGSDSGITNGHPGASVAIANNAPLVAVVAGGTSSPTLTITRDNFSGPVALAAENLPAGITATFDPQPATGNTSVMTLHAAGGVPLGNHTVLVRAVATGVSDATATFSIAVTATPSVAHAFKSVVAGNETTCALASDGIAYCWGLNSSGQLGNGTTSISLAPVAVAGSMTFEDLSVSSSGRTVCGIRTGGAAYCWGNNDFSQLGDGTMVSRSTPTLVAGGLTFQSISVGQHHTCGATHDFTAYCWGLDSFGAFGDGTTAPRMTPVAAASGLPLKSVSAADDYTCALSRTGAAYCWGLGASSQLGSGTTVPVHSLTPLAVAGGLTFNALASGAFDTCGLTTTGEAYCWGDNLFGQNGDGTTTRHNTPVAVAGGHTFTSIGAGFEHFCAVAAGGTGYCWGFNDSAELGDGSFQNRSVPTPVLELITGPIRFRSLTAGYSHACGVTQVVGSSNEIYCWGTNFFGELGDGTAAPTAGPFEVLFL